MNSEFLKQSFKGIHDNKSGFTTVLAVIGAYIFAHIPLLIAVSYGWATIPDATSTSRSSTSHTMISLILMLLPFAIGLFVLKLSVEKFHNRTFLSLITVRETLNWSKIVFAFALWFGLGVIFELFNYFLLEGKYEYHFDLVPFLCMLAIAFSLLLLQIAFEEIFVRGYLMQSFAIKASKIIVPIVMSSLIFGMLHLANPEVIEFGLGVMMVYYIGCGMFLAILAVLDDSLELPLGIHAATNVYGALIVGFKGSALVTPTLFTLQQVDLTLMVGSFFISAIIFLMVVTKKYQLKDIRTIFSNTDQI